MRRLHPRQGQEVAVHQEVVPVPVPRPRSRPAGGGGAGGSSPSLPRPRRVRRHARLRHMMGRIRRRIRPLRPRNRPRDRPRTAAAPVQPRHGGEGAEEGIDSMGRKEEVGPAGNGRIELPPELGRLGGVGHHPLPVPGNLAALPPRAWVGIHVQRRFGAGRIWEEGQQQEEGEGEAGRRSRRDRCRQRGQGPGGPRGGGGRVPPPPSHGSHRGVPPVFSGRKSNKGRSGRRGRVGPGPLSVLGGGDMELCVCALSPLFFLEPFAVPFCPPSPPKPLSPVSRDALLPFCRSGAKMGEEGRGGMVQRWGVDLRLVART